MIGFEVVLALSLLALVFHLLGTVLVWRRKKKKPTLNDWELPAISILKPLKGIDDGLEENLRSFFEIDYPCFEIFFSIKDADDPAIPIVRKLIHEHRASISAELIIGDVAVGVNPKVCNLIKSYERAHHDLILISDSNIRVGSNYLREMAEYISPGMGVVTAAVTGIHPQGLGGRMEAMYLNTFYTRGVFLADWAGQGCVFGKSMLFRRSEAARFGGLKHLANYLAEDYMSGVAMRLIGKRVVLMSHTVKQYIGQYSVRDFWHRHIRWGRIRKAHSPAAFLLELITACVPSALMMCVALHGLFGIPYQQSLPAYLLIWGLCDFAILSRHLRQFDVWMPFVWFVRELVFVPQWVVTALGRTIQWRGQKLVLRMGGEVEYDQSQDGEEIEEWA